MRLSSTYARARRRRRIVQHQQQVLRYAHPVQAHGRAEAFEQPPNQQRFAAVADRGHGNVHARKTELLVDRARCVAVIAEPRRH
ncbi:hypothetical protein WT56_27890 [Burkholderia pseudomultivorans]|uniref:Uncharacterized protein n=1 Tax=Burkholderia pseudomultivorans TaxID=1207504 RepID=A0A132EAB3_9BURK|nr:hypothetical protein WT56_27890 [Burkholderia pseudomultivorans]